MSRSIADLDLIVQRGEAMALKLTGLMSNTASMATLDALHNLVQDLVVIRQAALAIKEADLSKRTWSMPKIPGEVKKVKDRNGHQWSRITRPAGQVQLWQRDGSEMAVQTERDLIQYWGEIEEVPHV